MYFAVAQAESESKSCNIKRGIQYGFQQGASGYADTVCFGYKAGDDGRLAIDEPDAKIVRQMFELRADEKCWAESTVSGSESSSGDCEGGDV